MGVDLLRVDLKESHPYTMLNPMLKESRNVIESLGIEGKMSAHKISMHVDSNIHLLVQ